MLRINNPGLRFLIDFWSQYCPLEPWHIEWARGHIHVPPRLGKGDLLYMEGESQKVVYLVAQGLLGRVQYRVPPDDDSRPMRRQILSVALPGMALLTTDHLYTGTPSVGDIVVLRADTTVIEIPYRSIRDFKEKDPHIDTLIDVLGNKKRKQLAKLRKITYPADTAYENYERLIHELPAIHQNLNHEEIADLLGISTSTAKRCNKKWLNA